MIREVLVQTTDRMDKTIEAFRHELMGLRAGRATPALLDRVRVDYYGTPTPLQQLATITAADPRQLLVQPWDKSLLNAIEKAILKSDLGLVPTDDGGVIRLSLPQLTAERRNELVRTARRLAEEQRVAIRNERRDARAAVERLEKTGEIAADEARRGQDELQKLTDRAMERLNKLVEAKEKEILEV